ncbi:MAG: Uma2 family endonuclease, partial [Cyanobacteria bacterium P01_H01_bin.130]
MVATVQTQLSLDQFLTMPETEPASEYANGIVTQKPMPQGKHSRIQSRLSRDINQLAEDQKIALALTELRCTFGGRSLVPDIAVIYW